MKIKTLQIHFAHLKEQINTTGLLISRGYFKKQREVFLKKRKRSLLPLISIMMIILIILTCFVRRLMKKFTICAQFARRCLKPNLLLPCGRMICTNCVKKKNFQIYWCRTSTNITVDLDDFDCFFHVFQWLNFLGAPAQFFPSCFTWLVFVISWHFCVQSVWFWPFSLFFSRNKMSLFVEQVRH